MLKAALRLIAISHQRGEPGARDQLPRADTLCPGSDSNSDGQGATLAVQLQLDRVHPPERPSGDDLPTALIRARQDDDQLAGALAPDAVEAAQLPAECSGDIGERLLIEPRSNLALERIPAFDPHEQAAQSAVLAHGTTDLLFQAHAQTGRVQIDRASPVGLGWIRWVGGSHA